MFRENRARTTRALALAVVLLIVPTATAQDDGARPKAWLILAKKQLFVGAEAYPAFTKKHAATKRSALRPLVTAELKRLVASEQAKIREALGLEFDAVRSLWIVNAIVADLDAKQIEIARASGLIHSIHPAGVIPSRASSGKVSEVITPPGEREPFSPKGKTIPWNLTKLGAPDAWKAGATGEGVLVAMLDAGVNYRHTDLRNNIWINPGEVANNGKDDDGNGLVDDLYGWNFVRMTPEVRPTQQHHGTFTSSIVAGDGTGGTVTGVAPRARLMPLTGFGGVYLAAEAFQYAIVNGADVISMSFSIPDLGATRGVWRLMAEHTSAAGVVLVSGAGNFGLSAEIPVQIRIPEGIPCVICAGGVAADLDVPRKMSLGPVEWESVPLYGDHPLPKGLVKPDVCGFPGPKIGLVAPGDEGYLPENNVKFGNSLSAPHVAGVCALMFSVNPELTPWKVKELLEDTARDIKPRGKDTRTGAGLVRAGRAVDAARSHRK